MAKSTIAIEAKDLAGRLPAKDERFKRFVDVLKRYANEEPRHTKVIDHWQDAAGAIEVAARWLVIQSGNNKELVQFVKRAEAIGERAAGVANHADGVLNAASAGKYKSFSDDFQDLCGDIEKVAPDVAKNFRARLTEYATAENEAVRAAKLWRTRLEQIATEGKTAVAAMKESDPDTVQTRKFIETRLIKLPKDLIQALADIGG